MRWKTQRFTYLKSFLTDKSATFVSSLLYVFLVLGFIIAWLYFNKPELRYQLTGYIVFGVVTFLAILYFKYVLKKTK